MGKSIKEALREVGCETDKKIEEALSLVEECIEPLNKVISQRNVLKFFNISTEEPNKVTANDITIESEDLYNHLHGCDAAAVLAASLGEEVDSLIARLYKIDEKKAIVTQACAMVAIEGYCDQCIKIVKDGTRNSEFSLRERLSPGYGDFSLASQKEILDILDAESSIGITLTDDFIALPTMSMTAIVGIDIAK